ncbi:KGK domain-containing protein [Rivularia sp. UHCC 0363]|uniref:KGK domain-containing protein n=1 Tax=Rivularia sp. UHCC 0363 TaxID=3110244 RepID=UPI002B1F5C0D|nr:KGK domain-containing protein [Rivularia sp. UHCC 0363]MEA5593617.1 KGK domain-containing protein [Rivularia sp. UHCC 0363]
MNDKNVSISLDCDDDVVLFEKDTFKVSRLKELTIREVRKKIIIQIHDSTNKSGREGIKSFLKTITIGEENLTFNYIQFETIKDCQILQVNGKGWQKGKLNIEICISPDTNKPDKVNLEFFPEQPIKPESPLDDIRKMIQVIDGA